MREGAAGQAPARARFATELAALRKRSGWSGRKISEWIREQTCVGAGVFDQRLAQSGSQDPT